VQRLQNNPGGKALQLLDSAGWSAVQKSIAVVSSSQDETTSYNHYTTKVAW